MAARAAKRRLAAAQATVQPVLFTVEQAAVYCGVAVGTMREWIYSTRQIPSVRLGAGRHGPRRVKRADLDAYIAARTVPALRVVPGGVVAAGSFATPGKTRRAR